MVRIGEIQGEKEATGFCNYLAQEGIESRAQGRSDRFHIWVIDNSHEKKAKIYLQRFFENPASFVTQTAGAQSSQHKERKRNRAEFQKRQLSSLLKAPVNLTLIGISIMVAIITFGGDLHSPVLPWLLISARANEFLPEVMALELWRLITPVFIHFGLAHLFFNMYAMFLLGTVIELRFGAQFIIFFVLSSGVVGNLAQYMVTDNVLFGGMSGVLYGFFGFLWMKSVFDKHLGVILDRQAIYMMLFYYIICFFLPGIANTAHTAGLLYGVVFGYFGSSHFKKLLQGVRNHG